MPAFNTTAQSLFRRGWNVGWRIVRVIGWPQMAQPMRRYLSQDRPAITGEIEQRIAFRGYGPAIKRLRLAGFERAILTFDFQNRTTKAIGIERCKPIGNLRNPLAEIVTSFSIGFR